MITVFTPLYNRTALLPRMYESLASQDNCDFEWLIVDDGSPDHEAAERTVKSFPTDRFPIRYIYKENHGKYTAYNLALTLAAGDWFFCLDSDDRLAKGAVAAVTAAAKEIEKAPRIVGILALKSDFSGRQLSDDLPVGVKCSSCRDLDEVYGVHGEFSLVYRMEIVRRFPFPYDEKTRFMNECIVYDQMDDCGEMLLLPQILTECEYQSEGYSADPQRLMIKNPLGYQIYYAGRIDRTRLFKRRLSYAVRYHAFRLLSGRRGRGYRYRGSHRPLVFVAALPGFAAYLYYRLKKSRGQNA